MVQILIRRVFRFGHIPYPLPWRLGLLCVAGVAVGIFSPAIFPFEAPKGNKGLKARTPAKAARYMPTSMGK